VFSPTLDGRVLLVTVVATFAASLLFSLAPAVQFWNPRLSESLKQQSGTGQATSLRFRRTCVALQIGFSLLLIVAAGLFVRTIRNLRNVDAGFETSNLLTFSISPQMAGYGSASVASIETRILDTIGALPGIRSVGATNDPDLVDENRMGDVSV